jgi:hypothetical protein
LFATVLLVSPGMWLISVIPTWASRHATDGVLCPHSLYISQSDNSSVILLDQPASSCQSHTAMEVFLKNWLGWALFFLLGLQFTHLDTGLMRKFSLTADSMRKWKRPQWLAFASLIGLVALFALMVVDCMLKTGLGRFAAC